MGVSEEIRRQLINSFKAEQNEHTQKINQGLLALEKNPPEAERRELLKEIFREAHSLKGAARAVGMNTIEALGHALEELLLQAKDGRLTFSAELFDLMYQGLDAVGLVMAGVEAGESRPPTRVLTLLARLDDAARQGLEDKGQKVDGPPLQAPRNDSQEVKGDRLSDQGIAQLVNPLTSPPVSGVKTPDIVPQPAGPSVPNPSAGETIRVSVAKLDALMAQFSELLGAKIRAEQRLAEMRQVQVALAEWQRNAAVIRGRYASLIRTGHHRRTISSIDQSPLPAAPAPWLSRGGKDGTASSRHRATPGAYQPAPISDKDLAVLLDFVVGNDEKLRALNTQANTLHRQLSNDTMRVSLIVDELQEEIKRVRMLPLATITTTFSRMVRDLAREQGKQILLTISGGETELDKLVLEQVKSPLIHLLRNAVDHGIETPEARRQAGKPAEGKIHLRASQQGNNIIIAIQDDGRGLDLPAIRAAAVRRGLLSPSEVERLSNADIANLIFNSGLSTSKLITDISGRGIGLDVVRQNVEELQGTLEVTFEPGQGTAFTLTLPLTLASSRGLLVQAGGQTFALPLSTVERMLQIKRDMVRQAEGRDAFTYQGKPMALARLDELLELPAEPTDTDQLIIVIIAVADKRLGVVVDWLAGEQEIVMKSMGRQLVRVGGIAGATVLGSGQVLLVLHAADLIKMAARTRPRGPLPTSSQLPQQPESKTILVVDDSITTRTLEKNILEAAGYEVQLAIDGEEAWIMLETDELPDLIISDIIMPRLNGFDLTDRVKRDSRFSAIPIILVTSLDSPVDKAHGIEVGADAYIIKSSFDQTNLLETIEQLV